MTGNTPKLKPALFMHIQKTAGSGIVDLARIAYGSDNVISHGDYLMLTTKVEADPSGIPPGMTPPMPSPKIGVAIYNHAPFISGHFGYDYAKELLSKRYSFTFLRDPIERILSYYYFCKTRDPEEFEIYALAQEISLNEFLKLGLERPSVKACIWNNQAWQLANGYGNLNGRNILSYSPDEILNLSIQHLDKFSYIGFAETFEKDRDHILKALGIVPPEERLISNANPNRPRAIDQPKSTLELLNELTHLDRALYKEAWRRNNSMLKKIKNFTIAAFSLKIPRDV